MLLPDQRRLRKVAEAQVVPVSAVGRKNRKKAAANAAVRDRGAPAEVHIAGVVQVVADGGLRVAPDAITIGIVFSSRILYMS